MKEIGFLVRNERIRSRMTQIQLARKAKVTQSTVSKLENGNMRLTIDYLNRIAKALGKRVYIQITEEKK